MTAQQLKNSILQMAVQGKLVPQNPDDEPASVLLQRIKAEKEELIKTGKIKKDKKSSEIFRGATHNLPYAYCEQIGKEIRDISDEIPFDIPDSWEWARCSTIGAIIRGSGIKRTETVESGMPCVRYGELYTTYNTSFTKTVSFVPQELFEQCKQIKYGDVLFTLTGENKPDIAKTVVYMGDETVAVGGDLAFWTHHGMNPLYLVYFMASPYTIGRKVNLATGDIIVHISGEKVGSILIPIPPLAEQDRIVAKIQELEPFISEYNSKNEAVSTLNTTFPEALKKSILQDAVQGKLVPQNPNDEPASVLLERIRAEKEALIKAGKIKKDKHESVIITRDKIPYEIIDGKERCIADEVPFELPESWCWCRLSDLAIKEIKRGKSPVYADSGSVLVFAQKCNVKTGGINITLAKYLADSAISKYPQEEYVQDEDIIVNSTGTGTLGRIGLYSVNDNPDNMPLVPDSHVTIVRVNSDLSKYIYYILKWYQPYLEECGEGSTKQKELKADRIKELFIPIPPLSEQKQIVQTIESTYSYCNKL